MASVAAVQPASSTQPAQAARATANRAASSSGRPRRTRVSSEGRSLTRAVPDGTPLASAYASPRPNAVPSAVYAAAAAAYRAGSPPSSRSGWVAAAIRRNAARTSSGPVEADGARPSIANGSSSGMHERLSGIAYS